MQKKRKILLITAVIILIVILAIIYLNYIVTPFVCDVATKEIRSQVIDIMNYANTYLQNLSLLYEDYFKISYDNNNQVSAIITNTGLINQVNMIMQKQVQNQLNSLRTKKITMPAGAFTGSSLLATFGIAIPINVQTICNCYTTIENTYESIGINQVKHCLYITLHVDMEVLIPSSSEDTTANNSIIMAESIIVGNVPDTLIIGEGVSDYLNLLP